jgi:hypothetical protein
MKKCIWICLLLAGLELQGQQITFDRQKTFQTMHSFGASDCWSMAMIGKYYPESKKSKLPNGYSVRNLTRKGILKG